MSATVWVLIVASHVYSGSQVAFQEFNSKEACVFAGTQAVLVAEAVGTNARAVCVPKNTEITP